MRRECVMWCAAVVLCGEVTKRGSGDPKMEWKRGTNGGGGGGGRTGKERLI